MPLFLLLSCFTQGPRDWGAVDPLTQPLPAAPRKLGKSELSEQDYAQMISWGEELFRSGAYGTERGITDVAGVFMGTYEKPCGQMAGEGCFVEAPVMAIYVQALDALDGVEGNLFSGNGGVEGKGYTHDLVLRFPPGSRLYGKIPLPEEVHTGLDVEAGASWPLGLPAVPVEGEALSYLPQPDQLGAGPAAPGAVRFRLTCALCHYSLDVDQDGVTDLHSARRDQPTAGSPYKPEHSWGVGNQDLAIGWIVALAANPLLLAPVFSGPIAPKNEEEAIRWVEWVRDNYKENRQEVLADIVVGLLLQPRGYSDVTPNGLFDTSQLPNLYTAGNWPSNTDGAFPDPTDRNNLVWTGTLDFTGLIGTCAERAGSVALPWEPKTLFQSLPCDTLVDMMLRYSPAGVAYPERLDDLKANVLGTSDGQPGLMNPEDLYLIPGSPALPEEIAEMPINAERLRSAADYGPTGPWRATELAPLGYRIHSGGKIRQEWKIDDLASRYPDVPVDEILNHSINLMLDWMQPPPNETTLLANAAALLGQGREVFEEAGCDDCHRGPYGTDNLLHPISEDPRIQYGGPKAPSTAGWRVLDRGQGPAINTPAWRGLDSRTLRRLVSPPYDPATGELTGAGSPLSGLLGVQRIGYKSTILRNLWISAPFLHDGSVGVALRRPGSDDLAARLALAGTDAVVYGMGPILAEREKDVAQGPRPDAALSLQALLLRSERERVQAGNRREVLPVVPGSAFDGSASGWVSMAQLGAFGTGHDFYVRDVPGGRDITALVAYLLAQDDCPARMPGEGCP